MSKRILGPFNRVEGDLEVHIECGDAEVTRAEVVSPLYRGFEHILFEKAPFDALVYTPRICGICSVSQSIACAKALASYQGVRPSENGQRALNILLACENVADHLTHFYMFFMPDFCRDIYQDHPWFVEISTKFKAVNGKALKPMLSARSAFMHLMGTMAGKWPHSLAIQPGGTTRALSQADTMRVLMIVKSFRRYLEEHLFGTTLEEIVSLEDRAGLYAYADKDPNQGDFKQFIRLARQLKLGQLGFGPAHLMSYGAYETVKGDHLFAQGRYVNGTLSPFDQAVIREDITNSHLNSLHGPQHPMDSSPVPDINIDKGYSWCKAPRYDGACVEVGACARQSINGNELIVDLLNKGRGNVEVRIVARLVEIAHVVLQMEPWLLQLEEGVPFCTHQAKQKDKSKDYGEGIGLEEAARGSLGHWIKVKDGKIENYQIIAPTTWNFSPRDETGVPGALEQALVGAPIQEAEQDPVSVQHVVRSFDPCMVCTVH